MKKLIREILILTVLTLFVLVSPFGKTLAVEPTTFPIIQEKGIAEKGTAGVTFALTSKQTSSVIKADGKSLTVTMTEEQFKKIKRAFPSLKSKTLRVRPPSAAHYIPGGAVVSATVTGISKDGLAEAILLSLHKDR